MIDDAAADDLPRLARLMAESELLASYSVSFEGASAALREATEHGDRLLVARQQPGRPPVGLAWLMFTRALGRATYLRLLLVAEQMRGQGVGRRLMEAAEDAAAAWGQHMYLYVNTQNLAARAFYERLGYTHVGDVPALTAPELDEALYYRRV